MKKKVFLVLLVLVGVFTLTACGGNKKDDIHPNQTGYVEGKYSIDDLTFNLSEGFKRIYEENFYELVDDNNDITIYFYHDKEVDVNINDFIEADPHGFLPNMEKMAVTIINGNEWYKGITDDNNYVYFIKLGEDVYSILILPTIATDATLTGVISTLENSLYFK